jgi:hypothetical protein
MTETIEALIKGNARVVGYYERAAERWRKLLLGLSPSDVDEIADRATYAQDGFEMDCDHDRGLGKEIMAVVAIAHLYDTRPGFGDNLDMAEAVHQALQRSSCSVEVKATAREIAKVYDLQPST